MVEAGDVLKLAGQIPKGRISTYGLLARALGDKNLARFVGMALSKNPRPVKIPCHRVVCSDGAIGGYKMGAAKKIQLLEKEGMTVKPPRPKGRGVYRPIWDDMPLRGKNTQYHWLHPRAKAGGFSEGVKSGKIAGYKKLLFKGFKPR